jgi:conjugal transfer/type IV secretion protein DotA/TraY
MGKILRAVLLLILISPFTYSVSFAADPPDNKYAVDPVKIMQESGNDNNIIDASDIGVLPPGMFSGPARGDLALEMYRQLLGDTTLKTTIYFKNDHSSDARNQDVTLITYMLSIMSVLGMVVGVILTSYWMFIGLIKQNVEGEFMGKKWDSYMVPLRSTFSIIGMQPFPGFGGLSLIQVGVLVIILLGIGMGGAVLKVGANKIITAPIINSIRPDYMHFFTTVVESKICNETNMLMDNYDGRFQQILTLTKNIVIVTPKGTNSASTNITKRIQKFKIGEDGVCGTFELELANSLSTTSSNPVNSIRAGIEHRIKAKVPIALNVLWHDLDGIIGTKGNDDWLFKYDAKNDMRDDIIADKVSRLEAAYSKFVVEMEKAITEGLAEGANEAGEQEFIDMVGELGFAYTGALHYPLILRASAIEGAVSNFLPSITINEPFSLFGWGDDVKAYEEFKKYTVIIQHVSKDWLKQRTNFDHFSAVELMSKIQLGENNSQALSMVSNGMVAYISNLFRDVKGQPDPNLEMASLGRAIEASGLAVMAITAMVDGTGAAAAPVPGFSFLSGFLKPLGSVMMTAFYALLGLGFFYAEVIPAIPYIMWQIAIMGYFMYSIAALYAAPMGFAMMNHPDGDDAFGRASKSFEILINLAIRPALMVMGYFTGQALLKVMAWFINITYFPTFEAIGAAGGASLYSGIGKLAIYGLLMLVAFYKSNSMTWELPSMIASFMGLNQTHQDMGENEAQQKTLVMAGMISTNVTQLAASIKKPGAEQPKGPSEGSKKE